MLEVAALLVFVAAMLSTGASRQDNINVTIAIIGVVLLNATIGFFQEYRAEKATEALQKLVPANAKVIRDGDVTIVAAADLVPGDIIVLEEGDSISADARLVRQYELSTNNIALTGESDAVRKTADPIIEEELATINMPNLVFMGTSVASGTGRAVVFATGLKTEFGRIYSLTAGVSEDKSPLMREIDRWRAPSPSSRMICGVLLFFIALFVFGFGLCRRPAVRPRRHGRPGPRGHARHPLGGSRGRRAAHGQGQGAHQGPRRRRDPRVDQRDRHRQDRDAHQGRDDPQGDLGRRRRHRGHRRRLRTRRRLRRSATRRCPRTRRAGGSSRSCAP